MVRVIRKKIIKPLLYTTYFSCKSVDIKEILKNDDVDKSKKYFDKKIDGTKLKEIFRWYSGRRCHKVKSIIPIILFFGSYNIAKYLVKNGALVDYSCFMMLLLKYKKKISSEVQDMFIFLSGFYKFEEDDLKKIFTSLIKKQYWASVDYLILNNYNPPSLSIFYKNICVADRTMVKYYNKKYPLSENIIKTLTQYVPYPSIVKYVNGYNIKNISKNKTSIISNQDTNTIKYLLSKGLEFTSSNLKTSLIKNKYETTLLLIEHGVEIYDTFVSDLIKYKKELTTNKSYYGYRRVNILKYLDIDNITKILELLDKKNHDIIVKQVKNITLELKHICNILVQPEGIVLFKKLREFGIKFDVKGKSWRQTYIMRSFLKHIYTNNECELLKYIIDEDILELCNISSVISFAIFSYYNETVNLIFNKYKIPIGQGCLPLFRYINDQVALLNSLKNLVRFEYPISQTMLEDICGLKCSTIDTIDFICKYSNCIPTEKTLMVCILNNRFDLVKYLVDIKKVKYRKRLLDNILKKILETRQPYYYRRLYTISKYSALIKKTHRLLKCSVSKIGLLLVIKDQNTNLAKYILDNFDIKIEEKEYYKNFSLSSNYSYCGYRKNKKKRLTELDEYIQFMNSKMPNISVNDIISKMTCYDNDRYYYKNIFRSRGIRLCIRHMLKNDKKNIQLLLNKSLDKLMSDCIDCIVGSYSNKLDSCDMVNILNYYINNEINSNYYYYETISIMKIIKHKTFNISFDEFKKIFNDYGIRQNGVTYQSTNVILVKVISSLFNSDKLSVNNETLQIYIYCCQLFHYNKGLCFRKIKNYINGIMSGLSVTKEIYDSIKDNLLFKDVIETIKIV